MQAMTGAHSFCDRCAGVCRKALCENGSSGRDAMELSKLFLSARMKCFIKKLENIRYSASLPVSRVLMRITRSSSLTKIFPSPIFPVCAESRIASMA